MLSNGDKPLPVVAWMRSDPGCIALTPHAEAQHAIDCMEAEIEKLKKERDAALADLHAEVTCPNNMHAALDAAMADARRLRQALSGLHTVAQPMASKFVFTAARAGEVRAIMDEARAALAATEGTRA